MAHVIVYGWLGYMLIGLVFGVAFARRGAGAIDPAAREAPWGFKLLIIPAAAALWPWLLRRWIRLRATSGVHE